MLELYEISLLEILRDMSMAEKKAINDLPLTGVDLDIRGESEHRLEMYL